MLVKLRQNNGNTVWAAHAQPSNNASFGNGLTVDADGDVYVSGHYANSMTLVPGLNTQAPANATVSGGGNTEGFAMKYTANGNGEWVVSSEGLPNSPLNQRALARFESIAVDAQEMAYIAGTFDGEVYFAGSGQGSQTFVSDFQRLDGVLARVTAAGVLAKDATDRPDALAENPFAGQPADGGFRGLLYPNPATEWATYHFRHDEDFKAELQLFNALGQPCGSWNISSNSNRVQLHLAELPPGVHHYRVMAGAQLLDHNKFVLLR